MEKTNVLIVDDERNMRNLISLYLNKQFKVITACDGTEALSFINKQRVDLVILDVMMPGMDGWQVCKKIREVKQVPILMLTARTDVNDKVHGLKIGADDYLTKPFSPDELIARVHALFRRSDYAKSTMEGYENNLIFKELTINEGEREVYVNKKKVDITPKEFDLLYFFASHPNRVFTRVVLLEQIWGLNYIGEIRTVDTHVKTIREKIRKSGLSYNPIQTVWGVGYKFQLPVE